MKVYQINDCDWYAADSLEEAIAIAMKDTGLPRDEAADDPREVSDEEMRRLKYRDDDGTVRTFAEELQRRIDSGKTRPGMFASTEI